MPAPDSAVSSSTASPLRILIVEDESLVAIDLEERLLQLGYEVSGVVDNGADALCLLSATKVDIVLMDIQIKGALDGIQVAERLQATTKIPVIYLTSYADEATLERVGVTEPFGYVLKPFDERELRAAIQTANYRYRAEAKIRNMERWLSNTLQSIGDGVIATDGIGSITFLNPMAEAITGWTRGTALGRQLTEVFSISTEEGVNETIGLIHRAMIDGLSITLGEVRFLRTRDGNSVPIDYSVAPIRGDNDLIRGCVIVFRDSLAKKQAEAEREKLEAKMQEAQRLESLGILASGIAHDFNNILVAVTCNASLARTMVPQEAPITNCLLDIETAAERAALLCRQMLAFAGKGEFTTQVVELSQFTSETANGLKIAIDKNTKLELDLGKNLPPILADKSQLQQVIVNLVTNGSEALEGHVGTVRVRTEMFVANQEYISNCRVGQEITEGPYLLLEVSDTGKGMPPELLKRIFDPFFTTKFTGRGLGLAAVRGIINRHQGALAVRSSPGGGTVFQVLFRPTPSCNLHQAPQTNDGPWRGFGKALVVDDDKAILIAASLALRRLGFEVETAGDGVEGVAKAKVIDFRIVLLDVTMPKMNGPTACKAIREIKPDLPILMMSGYSIEDLNDLTSLRPLSFLPKPFTVGDLRTKLKDLLSTS